jgi:hypothetical protein
MTSISVRTIADWVDPKLRIEELFRIQVFQQVFWIVDAVCVQRLCRLIEGYRERIVV